MKNNRDNCGLNFKESDMIAQISKTTNSLAKLTIPYGLVI